MDETKYKPEAWAVIQSATCRRNRVFLTDDVTTLYWRAEENGPPTLTSQTTREAVLRVSMDDELSVKMTILQEGLEVVVDGEQRVTHATHLPGEHYLKVGENHKFNFFYLKPDGCEERLEGYRVVCEMERGSFGSRHFKCVNLANDQLCGVKQRKDGRQMALECAALRRLRHPNVVEVNKFNRNLMELDYFPGGDLQRRVFGHGKLLDERDIKIVHYQLALALEYLHKNDVVHCDVRPANVVLVDRMGTCAAKLAGFESCVSGEGPNKKEVCLTPYSAPEAFKSFKKEFEVTKAVDVWGFAVTLYYVITGGELPFGSAESGVEYAARVRKFKVDWENEVIKDYDTQAVSLLMVVLLNGKEKRISASEVVNAPYFRKDADLKSLYNILNRKS